MIPFTIAVVIAVLLLALAGFFGWQQVRLLRRLRGDDTPADERSYLRRQAWRRLVCSALLAVTGLLVAGSFISGQERRADELGKYIEERRANQEPLNLTPEQLQFRQNYALYWIVVLLVLLAVVGLAGFDLWSVRRYGLRHQKQIQADRREMLENELTQLRTQRNGHG